VLVPPLLQCYLALSMACCICAETGLGSFCKAVGSALEKLLGWAGKLLVALLGLERISTLQLDRAALRTGQLLTGTVPIIGETLRDASETVLSSLQLEKRAGAGCAVDHCSRIRAGLSGNADPAGPAFRMRTSMRTDGQCALPEPSGMFCRGAPLHDGSDGAVCGACHCRHGTALCGRGWMKCRTSKRRWQFSARRVSARS
jgi:hypothetical protein